MRRTPDEYFFFDHARHLDIQCPILVTLIGALIYLVKDEANPGLQQAIRAAKGRRDYGTVTRSALMILRALEAIGHSGSTVALATMMASAIDNLTHHHHGAACAVVRAYREGFGDEWAPLGLAMLLVEMNVIELPKGAEVAP